VRIVLLVLGAACMLFTQELDASQAFELHIASPTDAPLQCALLKSVETGSGEIQKYSNSIVRVDVEAIRLAVKKFKGKEGAVLAADLEFAPGGSTTFTQLARCTNLDLQALAASGEQLTLQWASPAVKQKLNELLRKGHTLTLRLNATTSDTPLAATLVVNFDAAVTVEL